MTPLSPLRLLPLAAVVCLVGCATPFPAASPPDPQAEEPSEAQLRQAANSAIAGKGFADVRLIDGVAYVGGDVANAIDRNAVVRTLEGFDGVERVESLIKLDM